MSFKTWEFLSQSRQFLLVSARDDDFLAKIVEPTSEGFTNTRGASYDKYSVDSLRHGVFSSLLTLQYLDANTGRQRELSKDCIWQAEIRSD